MKIVQQWMLEHGITQGQLGARLGITQSAVSRLLTGRRRPSIGVLVKLARVTGLPAEDLLGVRRRLRGLKRAGR